MPDESKQRLHPGRRWFVLLALLALIGGAAYGWFSRAPLYQSTAVLYVEPVVRSSVDPEAKTVPPMLDAYIDSRLVFMGSDRVLRRALESERLQARGLSLDAETLALLKKGLRVHREGLIIFVTCLHEDPDVAAAMTNSVTESFQDISRANSFQQDTERLREAEKTETLLQSKIEDITNRILDSAMEYGGPETLEAEAKVWLDTLAEASIAVRRLRRQLEAMGVDPEGEGEGNAVAPAELSDQKPPVISNEEIALQNPRMAVLLQEREKLAIDIDVFSSQEGFGDQHPKVVRARRNLEVVEKEVLRIRTAYLSVKSPIINDVARLKGLLRMNVETMQVCRVEAQQLGRIRARIGRESSDKDALVAQLDRERRLIEEMQFQLRDKGRITVVSWGEASPAPIRDHRLRFAGIRGAIGVGLVLLLGLCGVLLSRLWRWMNA